jgi:hypothetical protein
MASVWRARADWRGTLHLQFISILEARHPSTIHKLLHVIEASIQQLRDLLWSLASSLQYRASA